MTAGTCAWAALGAAFLAAQVAPLGAHDLGIFLATGREVLSSGALVSRELFSHACPGVAVSTHEWLFAVAAASLERVGGLPALSLLRLVPGALLLLVLAAWATSGGRRLSLRSAAAAALLLGALVPFTSSRPQFVSFVLLAALLRWGPGVVAGPPLRSVLVFAAGFALWANVHGAFLAGLALGALLAAEEALAPGARLRSTLLRWGGALAAGFAGTMLNPDGVELHRNLVAIASHPGIVRNMDEWRPPLDASYRLFHLSSAAWVGLVAASFREIGPRRLLAPSAFLLLALSSGRHVPLFLLVSVPTAVLALRGLAARLDGRAPAAVSVAVGVAMGAGLAGILLSWRPGIGWDERTLPVAAANRMAAMRYEGPIFNMLGHGGYLIQRFHPSRHEYRVFVDGRVSIYVDRNLKEYLSAAFSLSDPNEILERWKIRTAIVSPGFPIARSLDPSRWRRDYADPVAEIWVRRSGATS